MSKEPVIFTIGHSTHSIDAFISLLDKHNITAVADVRSSPFSRFNPQFNREDLKEALKARGIAYVFLGKELGARSDNPDCYIRGKVSYELLAKTDEFESGLKRVLEGAWKYRIALMCAEKEPLECHRTILVSRHLIERNGRVIHVLADGTIEEHYQTMRRLMEALNIFEVDMFRPQEEVLAEAYRIQGEKIAYVGKGPDDGEVGNRERQA